MIRVGFLGFGEAGSCFARIAAAGGADVAAFDHNIAQQTPKAAAQLALADRLGVTMHASPADLRDRDLILSVVAPRTTLAAAAAYAPHARAGQIYVDLNSTTPTVKQEVDALLAPAGVDVVDGVLVGGGVRLDGDEVPILLAGPGSEKVATWLRDLGLKASSMSEEIGSASALKMLRSAAIKGFEAMCIEMLIAAERYDLVDEVMDSLASIFDGFPARTLIEHLVQSHADHCGRRSGEVEMVRDTIAAQDVDTVMISAALEVFERSARAPTPRPWDDSRSLEEVLGNLGRAMDEERRARLGGSAPALDVERY
jgi:3-hydroxyisobutyrate dehydrogenase-like beta-hydroxyacid dehydrogenase